MLVETAELEETGGMTPLPPVEIAVALDPLMVIVVAPDDTIVSTIGVSVGVSMPSVPVEMNVEFMPDTVKVTAPEDTMTSSLTEPLGGMMPSVPVEKKVENTSLTVTLPSPPGVGAGVGVTILSAPVDPCTAVEKKVVIPPSPLVVDAGTRVGPPPTPPPPPMVVVLSPEIMVV